MQTLNKSQRAVFEYLTNLKRYKRVGLTEEQFLKPRFSNAITHLKELHDDTTFVSLVTSHTTFLDQNTRIAKRLRFLISGVDKQLFCQVCLTPFQMDSFGVSRFKEGRTTCASCTAKTQRF